MVKVAIIFLVIFLLSTRLKKWIAVAIFTGAILSGILFAFSPVKTFVVVFKGMFTLESVSLSLLVSLITVMGSLMKETNLLDDCREYALKVFPSARSAGAFMASLIGLLPMPGGALFSAPLVGASIEGEGEKNSPGLMTALNYWFRHVWEFWWPLYPGIIALLAVTGLDLSQWIPVSIVFTPLAIFLGWIFLLRRVKVTLVKNKSGQTKNSPKAFMPLLSVIISAVIFKILAVLFKIDIQTAFLIIPAVLIGILINLTQYRHKKIKLSAVLNWQRILPIAVLLLTIMGYKAIIEQANIATGIAADIQSLNLPVILLFVLLPFIAGVITGIAVGYIGASFPLIVEMLADFPQYSKIAVLVLAFGWGYVGMMLSPFHACFLFSKDYFYASWKDSYKYLWLPAIFLAIAFTIAYILLELFS
ncbi:MAG: hypothetical protein APR63_08900 [Desulfuromonas sp. SDB]|nr:MAG: hypothetical protein APR63_08900 [Desulfuromonas sp. SDB]